MLLDSIVFVSKGACLFKEPWMREYISLKHCNFVIVVLGLFLCFAVVGRWLGKCFTSEPYPSSPISFKEMSVLFFFSLCLPIGGGEGNLGDQQGH
jgi:hypothetical protein